MSLPGPDARVVELRVPGLVGVSGEQLLDSVATVTVDGDQTGEIIRPADRLRRPAPGPVLQALGRSLPRTLEGYLWHRMTSGGAAKATWALLFPFSLANVAHGMLPPVPERSSAGAVLSALCQAMLRVLGLLLTMLLVTQLGAISLDLLATQCLPDARCLPDVPGWVSGNDLTLMAAGLLPPLLVIGVLHRVSVVSWRRVGAKRATTDEAPASALPGDALVSSANEGALRSLHTLAALATLALLPVGGPFTVPHGGPAIVVWAAALCVLVVVLLAVALLHEGAHRLRATLMPVIGIPLIAAAVALVVFAGLAGQPTSVDAGIEALLAALLASTVAFALLLIPAALLARPLWRTLPARLRPWFGGWAAAPTVMLAALIGAGFGAGLAISLREIIGQRDALRLPEGYEALAVLWGAATIVAVLLWFGMYFIAIPLRKRLRGVPAIVRLLQREPDEQRAAADAWARSIIERKHLHRVVGSIGVLLGAGALTLAITGVPDWLDPLAWLGVLALGLLAVGLLRMVYTAAKTPERSRHLGALADLVYFWPRRAHPIVPPSYALKVVPDLVEHAAKHLREPNTRVVLAGYSHGGLLAMISAARLAAQLPEATRERLGLLTAGTPAQWGYQRAFPALFSQASLAALYGTLEGRWRGLCRGTDPFGGGVTTWRHQVVGGKLLGMGYLPDGTSGALPSAVPGAAGALVLGGDHWLPDPVAQQEDGRRWSAGVLRHADYLVDAEWDRAVAMAAGLEQPGAAARPNGSQAALFGDLPRLPPRS